MFGFSKLHVKPAAGSLNKFTFNPVHLTTTDFGQLNVIYSRMLYPRESISIDCQTWMRTEALVKPTFGRAQIKTAAIVVPMKRLFMSSDGFFGNKNLSDGALSQTRIFPWGQMVDVLRQNAYGFSHTSNVDSYDFLFKEGNVTYYQKFTNVGRYVYKILRSLGYSLPSNIDLTAGSYYNRFVKDVQLNAIPLLAFLTAYNDCFAPRAKQDVSTLSRYLYNIRANDTLGSLSFFDLANHLKSVKLYYGNSYITSAWETPNTPIKDTELTNTDDRLNVDLYGINVRNDIYLANDMSKTGNEDHGGIQAEQHVSDVINYKAIDYVKRATMWFKRNMLSGSRAYEALKSQFGITTSSAQHDFSHILDVHSQVLDVGDVTSQSDTGVSGAVLGDYAGKAIGDADSHFNFKAGEHCYLLLFNWLSVEPFNWQGMSREVLRIHPLDFYQPEFDGLDSQPVLRSELATLPDRLETDQSIGDMGVFGFVNRYDDMRFSNDMITGDLSYKQFDKNLRECWHFGRRDLSSIAVANMHAQSEAVLSVDGPSYDNIFQDFNTDADHFICQHLFSINLLSPLQSFNEVAQLGVGDLTIERNGSQLS